MNQKKIIFSAQLQDFRPIIWYGEPVYMRYTQLKAILTEKLGEKFGEFLAEPVITKDILDTKGKAHWMSSYIADGKPFATLPADKQEQARQYLQQIISRIKQFAAELQASENNQQHELGELLLFAIEVPGLNYILVDNDKLVLVLWGFSSEEAKKVNFQINKVIEAPINTVPPVPEIKNEIPVTDQRVKIEKQLDEQNNNTNNTTIQNTSGNTPPPVVPPPVAQKEKKKLPPWLWFILGALLMGLILFLIWFFFLRKDSPDLPEHGELPPIDTTQYKVDPNDPAKRKIFTNKVNVALNKHENAVAFAEQLLEKYKNDLEIVFIDTVIKLIQVKTPEDSWKQWSDSLKKFKEVRLTFTETLFERGDIPTDPAFKDAKKSWYFNTVKAYDAWNVTKGSPDVVIAVLDNGFDAEHPELKGQVVSTWNVVEGTTNVHPVGTEGSEHGTHVAATVAGNANNNAGVSGIAPGCKLMLIQLGDKDGLMSSLAVVAGLLYAIHKEADVVNMSLGMYFPQEVLSLPVSEQKTLISSLYPDEEKFWEEMFSFATENQIVLVQAAGNQNILAGIDPFARSLQTIIVGAMNTTNGKAEFSNFGDKATLCAPGVEIFNAIPGNSYKFLQGTSMASPIVAGGVALVKSKHPDWTAKQVIDALVRTGIPVNSDQNIGPLIQLDRALAYNPSDSVLVIPENPKDLAFAEGRYKSTSPLLNTLDSQKVELYFDLKKDGTGKLTLVEEKGLKCYADLDVSFNNGKLLIVQKDKAQCENNKFYYPYKFECVQGENNIADCKAKQKNGTGDLIDFNLKKL